MTISENIRSIADSIERRLPSCVKPNRLQHIRRVETLGRTLAKRFKLDEERARLVTLAHDMDRDLAQRDAEALVRAWDVSLLDAERSNPSMVHGAITAERLRREYALKDRSILIAIRHHTLGSPDFDDLGFLLFVADFCEPGRPFLSESVRTDILSRPRLEEMVIDVLNISRERFGPLEEPSAGLYARLQGV